MIVGGIPMLLGWARGNSAYGLTATAIDNNALTTYTFANVNLGPTDDPERWIFVVSTNQATSGNGAGGTWTLTIGGVTATEIVRHANNSQVMYIHALKVAAGATATIESIHSLAGRGFAIAVYAVYGNVSITPVDNDVLVSTALALTSTTVAGGWLLACVSTNSTAAASYTGITTDYTPAVGAGGQRVSFGSAFNIAGTSLSYTHEFSGSSEIIMGLSFKWN